jgi:hypothetical protein
MAFVVTAYDDVVVVVHPSPPTKLLAVSGKLPPAIPVSDVRDRAVMARQRGEPRRRASVELFTLVSRWTSCARG